MKPAHGVEVMNIHLQSTRHASIVVAMNINPRSMKLVLTVEATNINLQNMKHASTAEVMNISLQNTNKKYQSTLAECALFRQIPITYKYRFS